MANQSEIAKEKFGGGLLFLPRVERGRDPVTELGLRAMVAEAN